MDKAEQKLLEITSKILQENHISGEINLATPLRTTGMALDSLTMLKLLTAIEAEMHLDLPEKYWGSQMFNSLSEIADYIRTTQHDKKYLSQTETE